jgi:hypothetical protein
MADVRLADGGLGLSGQLDGSLAFIRVRRPRLFGFHCYAGFGGGYAKAADCHPIHTFASPVSAAVLNAPQ